MRKPNKIVLVTGGFDPIHSGHIEYFKEAKELGDILIVGLNSDSWLAHKKGQPFLPIEERQVIVDHLYMVDQTITFDDSDGTSIDAIKTVRQMYPDCEIIFANGGDRTNEKTPELIHKDENLIFKFGIGGLNKKNSSSWILEEWKNPKYKRPWGWYRVLDNNPNYKVKELVIEPGKRLSMQKHNFRGEHWYILKGKVDIVTIYEHDIITMSKCVNETYFIETGVWHQGQNNSDEYCHILEVQYGEKCIEEDIERRDA